MFLLAKYKIVELLITNWHYQNTPNECLIRFKTVCSVCSVEVKSAGDFEVTDWNRGIYPSAVDPIYVHVCFSEMFINPVYLTVVCVWNSAGVTGALDCCT